MRRSKSMALPEQTTSQPSARRSGWLTAAGLGLVIGLVAGYGAGRVLTGTLNPLSGAGGYDAGYKAATADAIQKLEETGLIPPVPEETLTLSGTVMEIKGDEITLEVDLTSPNPLVTIDAPKTRTVQVTEATKLYKLIELTQDEQQRAFEIFDAAVRAGEDVLEPPQPFKREAMELDDLRAGDIITVTAENDIFNESYFEAVEISLQVLSAQPLPPEPLQLPESELEPEPLIEDVQ